LPFGDGIFDVVLAVTVLCLVEEPLAAVREMARVLAPGGRLVVGELGRWSVWAAERRVRGWFGAATWSRAHFCSRRELMMLARAASLRPVQTRGAVFFPPSGVAARLLAPVDPLLSRAGARGAAFLAISADKTP
jgi:SAM-dependent methyltransferase